MTRLEIQTRILRRLNDNPNEPVYWSKAEVQAAIAEGMDVLSEEAPFVKRTFSIPRRQGVQMYQLPGIGPNILAPYRLWLPDLHRRLEAVTLADLDGRYERWLEVPAEPWWWYPLSWDSFGVWPAPDGVGTIEVNCLCFADPLMDDSDEPEFQPALTETLVEYGVALGYLKQWMAQDYGQTLQQFLAGAKHNRALSSLLQVQGRFFTRRQAREGDARQRSL